MTSNNTAREAANGALNVDNFPADLRRQLKAHAAMNDMFVRDAVIQAIQMWVAAREDGGGARIPGTKSK